MMDRNKVNIIIGAVDRASPELKRVDGQVNTLEASTSKLASRLKLAGAALVGMLAIKVSRDLVAVNVEFDRLHASLVTVTGSTSEAEKQFEKIKEFTKTTPYQLSQVTEAFIKMKALGLDPSEAALRSYGNTASAMGKGLGQMVESVAAATTGEFQRLKQFGIIARNEGEFIKFTFRGITTEVKNSATDIEGYLRRLGDVEFAGGMERQMKTLGGALSNLEDAWNNFIRTLGEDTGAVNVASGSIDTLTESLNRLSNALKLVKELKQGTINFAEWLLASPDDAVELLGRSAEQRGIDRARNQIKKHELELAMGGSNPERARWLKEDIKYLQEVIAELENLATVKGELERSFAHNRNNFALPPGSSPAAQESPDKKNTNTKPGMTDLDWRIEIAENAAKQMAESQIAWEQHRITTLRRLRDEEVAADKSSFDERMARMDAENNLRTETENARMIYLRRLRNEEEQATTQARQAALDLGMTFSSAFEDAIINGNKLRDVLHGLGRDIARMVLRQTVTTPLAAAISGGLRGLFPSANGNVFAGGAVVPFASGGQLVNRPRVFPMANGATGLMGEAGEEGIFPLTRVGGKLGIRAVTNDDQKPTVFHQHTHFDFRGADSNAVPQIRGAADQIINQSYQKVRDSLRRGGELYSLARR